MEQDGRLPFLDFLFNGKEEGYIPNILILIYGSHQHLPTHKGGVLSTLVHRSYTISDAYSLLGDLEHL